MGFIGKSSHRIQPTEKTLYLFRVIGVIWNESQKAKSSFEKGFRKKEGDVKGKLPYSGTDLSDPTQTVQSSEASEEEVAEVAELFGMEDEAEAENAEIVEDDIKLEE